MEMEEKKLSTALVILSGGQDSTTCLFWATKYFETVHAVTFNYGQRHAIEIEAARNVAILAGVASHEVIDMGAILKGTSPLTNAAEPLEQYKSFGEMDAIIGDRVEKTFVPMRNALFLTIAANRAVVLGAEYMVTGVCQEDNANYPDCRQDFIDSMEATINEALGTNGGAPGYINVCAPLMNLSKAQSILAAQKLGCYAHLAFTHTAYDGAYPPVGNDHATLLRAHGFEEAGLPDPLVIRAISEGLMSYPDTPNYIKQFGADNELLSEIMDLAQHLELAKQAARV